MATLTEQEIRPKELMDQQRAMAMTDLGRMLSRYSEFVQVDCPACGSAAKHFKYEKNGIRYDECEACETFYVNPRPSSEVLDWFYRDSPNYAYWNDVIFPASEAARREKIFKPRVDNVLAMCAKYNVPTGSLLEVGAGFGTFCTEVKARDVFKRVVAVEPTRALAETCRQRGLEVIEKPIEHIDMSGEEGFDVVANFEVIEHLFDPSAFIRDMTKLLRPGGIMVLACPNGKGFDVEVLGTVSKTVDHEHLNYFNPASLGALMESHGMKVLESFTPGKLDADLVRNRILSGEYDATGQDWLKKILVDEWETQGQAFQDYLVANNLSSNMWIVAAKN